jgi:uncharacterized ParB-like nuclease family protein
MGSRFTINTANNVLKNAGFSNLKATRILTIKFEGKKYYCVKTKDDKSDQIDKIICSDRVTVLRDDDPIRIQMLNLSNKMTIEEASEILKNANLRVIKVSTLIFEGKIYYYVETRDESDNLVKYDKFISSDKVTIIDDKDPLRFKLYMELHPELNVLGTDEALDSLEKAGITNLEIIDVSPIKFEGKIYYYVKAKEKSDQATIQIVKFIGSDKKTVIDDNDPLFSQLYKVKPS